MFDLSFIQIVMRAISLLIIMALHGYFIALIARLLGERGPEYDGKLTINPFTHMSLIGFLVGIYARAAWVKPMAIDPAEMRMGRLGLVICALGALAGTLALGYIAFALLAPVGNIGTVSVSAQLNVFLRIFANMATWFAVVNLLPIPPMTGGYVLQAIVPAAHRWLIQYVTYIAVALAVLFILTRGAGLENLIMPIVRAIGPG